MGNTTELPRVIWITGASSGIGEALALAYARDGAKVAVTARRVEALAALEAKSSNIKAFPGDVTDADAIAAIAGQVEATLGPIDLAILNAGIWRPMSAARYEAEKARVSMDVNYQGVVNALEPVMRAMLARGRGHIAIVSSVAGYRGLPLGATYAPTKAALISLAECLYPELKAKGVAISVINPGFVATPMTAPNTFPMPFIISVDDAVKAIRKGLARGRFEIVFPFRMAALIKLARVLPYALYFRTIGGMANGGGGRGKDKAG